MARSTGPTAAIAGITPGIQGQGAWTGRRQLFVRFAGEAETAVLYNGEMLAKQVDRAVGTHRAPFDRARRARSAGQRAAHRRCVRAMEIESPGDARL